MTVTISPVSLLNGDGKPEDAELWDAITERQLADWEGAWVPELFSTLKKLNQAGVPRDQWPQNRHWDWRKKTQAFQGYLSFPCISLMCADMTQGMMIMDTTRKRCRIEAQKGLNLVYIEYIEAAPWNRRELSLTGPKYRGIGSILVRTSIEASKQTEFKGRIGLHSLPQANSFYTKIGMTDLGPDPSYHNLNYFEITPDQANAFIKRGG